jgi:hypothetical protein
MKKFVMFVLAFGLILSMAACGSGDKETETTLPIVESEFQETASNVLDFIQDEGKNNADVEIEDYVMAADTDFEYEDNEDGVTLLQYTGTDTFIEIPAEIGGKAVTVIGRSCFQHTPVVAVKFPDSVREVGVGAFAYATTLVKAEFGTGLKVIGDSCFEGCSALSDFQLPEGLQSIGVRGFALTAVEEIKLPDSLTNLSAGAFCMAGFLESITIPGSVGIVSKQTFSTCASLTEVVIGEGITTVESGAFESCPSLVKVTFPASVTDISTRAFTDKETVVLYGPSGSAVETFAQEFEYNFRAE